jgi:hypothetical protein
LRELIQATSLREAHLIARGRPISVHCAKVVCVDEPWSANFPDWPAIEIHVPPAESTLPIFDSATAEQLQAQLMMYRLRNYLEPLSQPVELPELSSRSRELMHVLSPCLVGDSKFQESFVQTLQNYDDEFEKPCEDQFEMAAIEALLKLSHDSKIIVHLQEITGHVNQILEPHSALQPLKPRAVGPLVRRLGFDTRERDRIGFFVRLLPAARARIHKIARDLNVLARYLRVDCPYCQDFQTIGEKTGRKEEQVKSLIEMGV